MKIMFLNGNKSIFIVSLILLLIDGSQACAHASMSDNLLVAQSPGVPVRGSAPTCGGYSYNPGIVQYGAPTPYANPYYNQYNPYNNYYNNLSGAVYGAYPYSNYMGHYNIGGVGIPVYGIPQLVSGGYYGINVGGAPYQFWRGPSGFYYPWVAGYAYNSYPIYTVDSNSNTSRQTLPPVSTIISDMDSYLDKAKEKGKISSSDYQSLRLRANDLLSKEKSLAYESGGALDPDQEAEIRRDVEGLSAEVAHRVKP